MLYWLRWILVVPMAVLSWFLVLVIGFVYLGILDRLCPPDQFESGMCIASWYDPALNIGVYVCSAFSAFLVVSMAAYVAPSHKRAITWLAYAAGACVAISISIRDLAAPELICAFLGGAVGVAASLRWLVLTDEPKIVPGDVA